MSSCTDDLCGSLVVLVARRRERGTGEVAMLAMCRGRRPLASLSVSSWGLVSSSTYQRTERERAWLEDMSIEESSGLQ